MNFKIVKNLFIAYNGKRTYLLILAKGDAMTGFLAYSYSANLTQEE
jgi:hypothetical protein